MRKSALISAALLVLIVGTWWLAGSTSSTAAELFSGSSFTQLTGVLSIGLMAFGTFLAARLAWLEPYMGGLDKMYRLHKWMGIVGLVIGVVHWLTASGGHDGGTGATGTIALLQNMHGQAKGIAQPALWVLLALGAVALIKKIPYDFFALSHRLMPLLFLLLTFHSVVLMNSTYWSQPIGWVMAVLYLVGTIAALMSLTRLIGAGRKVNAIVVDKFHLPEKKTLRVGLKLESGWKGHKPGQFAFMRATSRWVAHPFTIASHWDPQNPYLRVIVKELGDATEGLNNKLPIGAKIVVEGPYGQFNFESEKPRQIWISGGIGITPFVARMKHLAEIGDRFPVDLFHSDLVERSEAYELMQADAAAAQVSLHLNITPRDGRLTGERIRRAVPEWKNASFWFCGPSAFAAALKLDFFRHGLNPADFHYELFEMR